MGKSTTIATTNTLDQQVGVADNSEGDGQRINPTTTGNNNRATIQTGQNVNNSQAEFGNLTNFGSGQLNIAMTDFGAVAAGVDVASQAIAANSNSVKEFLTGGFSLADKTMKYNSDALGESLGFANAQANNAMGQVNTLAKAQQAANAATVDKVLALTENIKTDGASQQNKLVAALAGGLLLTIIVVAVVMSKKK